MIASYIQKRRWFRAKARGLVGATIAETYPIALDGETVTFTIVETKYADGGADHYVLPIALASGEAAARLRKDEPHLVIGDATPEALGAIGASAASGELLYDALGSERLLAALLAVFRNGGRTIAGKDGTLVLKPFAGFDEAASAKNADLSPRPTKTEQTNTSIVFGNAFILKIVRQLDPGTSAELEMGAFLTAHGHASSPAVLGAIEIERPGAEASTVGVLHRFAANQGDAWTFTLKELAASRVPESFVPHAALLGTRVGEMHVVLASGTSPAFVVEALEKSERIRLGKAVEEEGRGLVQWLQAGDDAKIAATCAAFANLPSDPPRMRVHGDLHLGQILTTGSDFIIIDFEGEPSRSLAERKAKRSPFADVAGMLRSFDYAAASAQRSSSGWSTEDARAWYAAVSNAFLAAYRKATSGCAALSTSEDTFEKSLAFYLLEKCLYELRYEANNRPDWIAIPQSGIRHLLDGGSDT